MSTRKVSPTLRMLERATIHEISVQMVSMQRRLFDVGLIATAHKVNEALHKFGWEAADKLIAHTRSQRRGKT